MPRHIRKGDTVVVTAGNFKGAVGEVLHVDGDAGTCVVKGVNVRAKRLRPLDIGCGHGCAQVFG